MGPDDRMDLIVRAKDEISSWPFPETCFGCCIDDKVVKTEILKAKMLMVGDAGSGINDRITATSSFLGQL